MADADQGDAAHPAARMDLTVTPVILCGGSGRRLWPWSRDASPKQLLPMTSEATMLQETAQRIAGAGFDPPIFVAGEAHRFQVRDQLEEAEVVPATILLEPEQRGTAAAIALAAFQLIKSGSESLMLVMPSDHSVVDSAAFRSAVKVGRAAASAGAIVAFGIGARTAETGYGYLEAGAPCAYPPGAFHVVRFIEKPDRNSAIEFGKNSQFFWNSGIILVSPAAYVAELLAFAPEIATACERAIEESTTDGPFTRPQREALLACPKISVDCCVMERTGNACIVPVEMGWSDVGSWEALSNLLPPDEHDNVISGDVIALDTRHSLLRSDGNVMIATIGLDYMVVVATRDAVLVAPKSRSQDVQRIVEEMERAGRTTHLQPTRVHRPWGTYEIVDRGDRFLTKRIVVRPGGKLSLQLHRARSEHWVVVSGTARVTIGHEVKSLRENESTYIPAGTAHRLENACDVPLHIIEVQCGECLSEDDIVRLADSYGR